LPPFYFIIMKKKLCNIFIILFSIFFFMLTSGIMITFHECCTNHHHAKNEHVHCHETKLLVKIQDEFIKSKIAHFSIPEMKIDAFSSVRSKVFFEIVTPHFQYAIPPLLKIVGVNFVNFTSQRIFYS